MDRQHILKEFSDINNPAEFFIKSYQRTPNQVALEFEAEKYTYTELFNLSKNIQHALEQDEQTKDTDTCILFAHKSITAYAAVLGILFAKKTYIPLNPIFPQQRNQYILERTMTNCILAGEECLHEVRQLLKEHQITPSPLFSQMKIIYLNSSKIESLVHEFKDDSSIHFISIDKSPSNTLPQYEKSEKEKLAYILFTSGSTGKPKGVMVKNSNVISYIKSMIYKYPLSALDRFTAIFDLTFDVSVHDMFTCWAVGGTLVPFQNSILMTPLDYAKEKKITIWFSVPSIPLVLENSKRAIPNSLPLLKHSFFAGEKFTYSSYETWKKIAPHSTIYNLYGPTEATVTIVNYTIPTQLKIQDTLNGIIPIGYPVQNQKTLILDSELKEVPVGQTGKMYVTGSQITKGYLKAEELTQKSFIHFKNSIWYDTGDIVQVDHKGCHHFLGRTDQQVQVMGYRVELGEIEHALEAITNTSHCIVGVQTQEETKFERIYAILLDTISLSKKEIRKQCRERLPEYMIPKLIQFVDQYPTNSSGKIDRKILHQSLLERKK